MYQKSTFMKKLLLSCCIVLFTSVAALAQLPNFNLGLKAGVNYSSLKTKDDLTDQDGILGYQVGAWARVGAAGVYFQPELYLGSKGNDFVRIQQENNNEVSARGKVRFTTLDLPLLLGTKFGPNKLNFRLMAGPVISFLIDKNTTFDSAYQNVTDFGNYKNQAVALQAGAGVDISNITIDLRYEAGLSKVNQSERYGQKQNLINFSLGLKLL